MSGMGKESKAEKERQKAIQDRCQAILTQLLRDEDNKYCVDCDAKGPRWASWNLGVFLCIRCAGIHRNLGVHISKVKSVNLDTWTPQQVVTLQQMGNSRARAIYEANLPDTWRRPQTDTSLEAFIRAKYQTKRYIAKEWVPPPTPEVDWDKEIEEEAERQKKRKKEKQVVNIPPIRKPISEAAVPPLPKPTNSPKAGRTSAAIVAPEPVKTSSAVDLLGLNTVSHAAEAPAANGGVGEDAFTSFLSAPANAEAVPQVPDKPDVKGLSKEEDSFFNQTLEAKKPMSKDSILALYSNQQTAPQQQMFHAPGMYPANPGYPANNTMFGNGMNSALPNQQMSTTLAVNPFYGMSSTVGMAPQQGIPYQHGSSNPPKPSDDLLGDFNGLNLGGLSAAPALNHHMSGMSLNPQPQVGMPPNFTAMANSFQINNSVTPAQQATLGQTFTTHLWQ